MKKQTIVRGSVLFLSIVFLIIAAVVTFLQGGSSLVKESFVTMPKTPPSCSAGYHWGGKECLPNSPVSK